jgi:hypothetical protein
MMSLKQRRKPAPSTEPSQGRRHGTRGGDVTDKLLTDANEFGGHLVNDLARCVYNAESDLLLNVTVGANGFAGINQISGTLSRAVATEENPIDTLIWAAADLRSDFLPPRSPSFIQTRWQR